MAGFTFNDAGFEHVVSEMTKELEAADAKFRRTHSGLPTHVVRADLPRALPAWLTLTDADADSYAEAVANDEDFTFQLEG
jgi:hypothetical protein